MAYEFPTEDLVPGQIEEVPQADGSVIRYQWTDPPGVWNILSTGGGDGISGPVTTADVLTMGARPTSVTNPFDDSADPLQTQQNANWYLWDAIEALEAGDITVWYGDSDTPPPNTDETKYTFWFDETNLELLIFYNGQYFPVSIPPAKLQTVSEIIEGLEVSVTQVRGDIAKNKIDIDENMLDVTQRIDNIESQGYVKKTGDEMSGNLHILRDSPGQATIDTVPLVVIKPLNEAGSIARFRIGQKDVVKINNEGQVEMEDNRIIEVGNPIADTDAATKGSSEAYADDVGRAANDYTTNQINQIQLPDTSGFLTLNGSRAMTGLLNMGNNTINSVADPNAATAATNRRYVDQEIAAAQASPQMQLQLWQFKGMASSQTEFQALRQGEFMIRHKTTSGSYDWELAINVKDKDGRYWYPFNNGSGFNHTNHIDYVTINDCFGTVRWGGKQESLHFNEWTGVGAYLRVDGRYWKQTYSGTPFTQDWWYVIKLSGLLPHWKYPLSVQQNGQSSFNTDFYGVDDANEELADANGTGEQS